MNAASEMEIDDQSHTTHPQSKKQYHTLTSDSHDPDTSKSADLQSKKELLFVTVLKSNRESML